jgi:divinyl protochlorophyllide a 8-vinyl-reductase
VEAARQLTATCRQVSSIIETPRPRCVVGPNAVIQLGEALDGRGKGDQAALIFGKAGCAALLERYPDSMINERVPARLFEAACEILGTEEAGAVLSDAGRRTGQYILANRIPWFARLLLPSLPRAWALRMLLNAISKHAWTFAGSGAFSYTYGKQCSIRITNNPLAAPIGCIWHAAVFEFLFSTLLNEPVHILELSCCKRGSNTCEFGFERPLTS